MRLSYRVSVLSEIEAEISPFLHHLVHVPLQRVFFTGQSSNLFQSIAKLNKSFTTMSLALQMYTSRCFFSPLNFSF